MQQTASTILMVRPASFGYNAETAASNAFQGAIQNKTATQVQQQALVEFDAFVELLRSNNIEVIVAEDSPQPVKPDAVFPNNWFCTLPDNKMIVFPMFAANRREEKSDAILQYLNSVYNVADFEDWSEYEAENHFLESTGSMIIDHANKIIYACLSPRTTKSLVEKFSYANQYKAITFNAKDENGVAVYHTNVILNIGETYAVVCLDAIATNAERIVVSQSLTTTGHEVIPITMQQVRAYAGNMLQVQNSSGKKFTVLSSSAYKALTAEQIKILSVHTNLLPVNINTIETIGGGSVRCMMAEIFLEKKQQ